MSSITEALDHALDVADARLKGGDAHNLGRRVEETREVLAAVVAAVHSLDTRLDQVTDGPPIVR